MNDERVETLRDITAAPSVPPANQKLAATALDSLERELEETRGALAISQSAVKELQALGRQDVGSELLAAREVVEAARKWRNGGSKEFRKHMTDVGLCRIVCGSGGHLSERFPGPDRNLRAALSHYDEVTR